MNKNKEEGKSKIKKNHFGLKATVNFAGMIAGVASTSIPIVGIPVGAGLILYNSIKFGKNIEGDIIKDSEFAVCTNKTFNKLMGNPDNYIAQDVTSIKQIVQSYRMKEKNVFFMTQTLNMLNQLPSKDENQNEIVYNTTSHTMTRYFLRRLEKMGYVDVKNDNKVETDKSKSLLVPNILFGNIDNIKEKYRSYREKTYGSQGKPEPKGILSKLRDMKEACRTDMYNISFTKKDKKMSKEDFDKIQKVVVSLSNRNNRNGTRSVDFSQYNINRDEEGNIISITPKSLRQLGKERKSLGLRETPKMLRESKDNGLSKNRENHLEETLRTQVYSQEQIETKMDTLDKKQKEEVQIERI